MGRTARFALCAVLGVLVAPIASAQVDTLTIETSEGSFTLELFDFPDVVDHSH